MPFESASPVCRIRHRHPYCRSVWVYMWHEPDQVLYRLDSSDTMMHLLWRRCCPDMYRIDLDSLVVGIYRPGNVSRNTSRGRIWIPVALRNIDLYPSNLLERLVFGYRTYRISSLPADRCRFHTIRSESATVGVKMLFRDQARGTDSQDRYHNKSSFASLANTQQGTFCIPSDPPSPGTYQPNIPDSTSQLHSNMFLMDKRCIY